MLVVRVESVNVTVLSESEMSTNVAEVSTVNVLF